MRFDLICVRCIMLYCAVRWKFLYLLLFPFFPIEKLVQIRCISESRTLPFLIFHLPSSTFSKRNYTNTHPPHRPRFLDPRPMRNMAKQTQLTTLVTRHARGSGRAYQG
ncbi:hypothetical protein P280DRAFT_546977 [Massarina eburnea CBS 473.64]|uniref:Uncharacterized protein n=1 Tax=Massarina eburnea CBS 473.64 TaxID=1395130 RepID=A0A6A6SBD3_9PLEO|nr:hypothetical protein P280DRAFT_546977 [Massarina eburnea CBS 473.64]